jgi:hypothetical protein
MLGLDVILGGLTGLLGNVVTGIMNFKTMKLKLTHERDMVKLETEAMKEEAKMQIEVTKAEIEGAVELADAQAYMQSQKTGNVAMFSERWIDKLFAITGWIRFIAIPFAVLIATGFAFVDWLRGFMRPAITLYLTGMTTVITWMAWDIMQKNGLETMTVAQALEIYDQVISIVIYLTVSCVTWWFGDRRMAKFLTQLNTKKEDN